jgi:hypothetical protein
MYSLVQYGSGYFRTLHGDKQFEKTVWFMAQLKPSSGAAISLQKNKDTLLNNITDGRALHLTLLTLHFNMKAPTEILDIILPKIAGARQLHPRITAIVNNAYDETFRRDKPVLEQVPSIYFMMGSFIAKDMIIPDGQQQIITDFRMRIYQEITKLLASNGYTIVRPFDTITDPEYAIISVVRGASRPIPIYAIPAYDFGKGIWSPHVSIGNIQDIKIKNPTLFKKFEEKVIEIARNPGEFANTKIEKFQLDTRIGKCPVYRWVGRDFYYIGKLNDPDDIKINMDTDITHVVVGSS